MHVTEYMAAAGKEIVGADASGAFGQQRKRELLAGEADAVVARLASHRCHDDCQRDEHKRCVVRAGQGYLENHRAYLDYPRALASGLPVGSGEAESGIRHTLKKRLDVAGAWREKNGKRMLALITVRASGLWDQFWQWRDARDIEAWHRRQRGEGLPRFHGTPAWRRPLPRAPPPGAAPATS